MIRDLTDDEARLAMPEKWGAVDPDVIPAWVAEMDFALAPEITDALHGAIDAGTVSYPRFAWGGELGEAYAGFAQRQYGHVLEPDEVCPVVDVTAGVRLVLGHVRLNFATSAARLEQIVHRLASALTSAGS